MVPTQTSFTTEDGRIINVIGRNVGLSQVRELTLISFALFGSSNRVYTYDIEQISSAQVPAGITPTNRSTWEEIDAYMAKVLYELDAELSAAAIVTVPKNSALKNAILDTKTLGLICSVKLQLTYSTSNGKFTYAKPYTTHTGITFDTEWKQSSCGCTINSAKTQVSAYAEGTASFYLLFKGLNIRLSSRQISLRGTAKI